MRQSRSGRKPASGGTDIVNRLAGARAANGAADGAANGAADEMAVARRDGGARAIAIDIALNLALPYAAYVLLERAGAGEARALILSALVPAMVAVASLIRRRRINALSLLVLAATALSLGATALSGSAWFVLIRPSFVTGSIALAFMVSLALQRPALFYLARDTTCPTEDEARTFEANWAGAAFRRSMRRLTVVWAVFLGGEAALRAGLAAIWPDPTLVAATQILWIVLPILLTRWSIRAAKRWASSETKPAGF